MLVTKTPRVTMAPNDHSFTSLGATPLVVQEEDDINRNLNRIPIGLFPEYRPLQYYYKLPLLIVSLLCGGGGVRKLLEAITEPRVGSIASILARTAALYIACSMGIQDLSSRYRPSRITVANLQQQYKLLPSKLSRYEPIASADQPQQRVHWIQYNNQEAVGDSTSCSLDAAVLFHGFGANCLSWLPSISPLSKRLSIRTCLAHDSPGFGLTDRGEDFTTIGSASIGTSLLAQEATESRDRILLIGHSMGVSATLQMALQLQRDPSVNTLHVLLVSPVLGRDKAEKNNRSHSLKTRRDGLFVRCISPVFRYVLRRLVGKPGFWRRGLQQAFVKHLTDEDVMRYQWPSIIQGWEDGLLRWILRSNPRIGSDLLSQVTKATKVKTVAVILGKQDGIIQPDSTKMFLAAFHPTVKVVELDGAGHDAMEEVVNQFVETVQNLVDGKPEKACEDGTSIQ